MKNTEVDHGKIHILHLSDLHLSDVKEDIDSKEPIPVSPEKIDKFKESITSLPMRPDYVVVSGDITTAANTDGFEIFNNIIVELISQGCLPSVGKFIIVPGNHDVKSCIAYKEAARWNDYKKMIGNTYLVPWIVNIDSTYGNMKAFIDTELANDNQIQGGIIHDFETGQRNSIPFLLDKDRKIIFYAFNSALLSHIRLENKKTDEITAHFQKYRSGEKDLMNMVEELEKKMRVDPALIDSQEIKLFTYSMRRMKDILKDDYDNYFKIAVLHHHIAPISCYMEVKQFEMLINAGFFKRTLAEYGFHAVLHGHKHWNEAYWDTAISGGGALLTVSGGTICGTPSKDKKAGFYMMDISVKERIVETHYYEIDDVYNSIIEPTENHVFNFGAVYKSTKLVPDSVRHLNVLDLFSRIENKLLCNIKCSESQEGMMYGWNRRLDDKDGEVVGMVATAYGLINASVLNINDISYISKKNDIVDSLWKFRMNEGGFRAISQTANPSIEATVWAVRALYYTGDKYKYQIAFKDLCRILKMRELDERSSISTLALVVDLLCECQPDSELIGRFREIILKKACCSEEGRPIFWPISNTNKEVGSPIFTILAVISLLNCAKVKNDLEQTRKYLHDCGKWILKVRWDNFKETISRMVGDKQEDKLVYNHYTAPWGIVALLRLGYDKREKRIVDEMRKLLEKEKDGVWDWNDEYNFPIWAVYDVITAIREYALCDIEL